MRRFLAGKVSVVEDGRMDGYYEEGEKYRNKRNYVPLVPPCMEAFEVVIVRMSETGAMRRFLAARMRGMDGYYEDGEE
jgi:hypothetical protein